MGKIIYNLRENRQGEVVSKENRKYDKFGRLAETAAGFGSKVTYVYDSKGRLARQVVNGSPIDYEYTKYGQLAGKYLGGKLNADASVTYEYSKSGQIVARTANGVRQTYEYDKKGQLLAVKDADGNAVERYAYDKAGNMLKKTLRRVRCRISPERSEPRSGLNEGCALAVDSGDDYVTTTFAFDDANQLVSSTTDGVTTRYTYDAAGRMVREGNKTYRYGYLDKVMSVTDGDTTRTFAYHADGQLASASCDGIGRAGAHASSDIASQCSLRSGDMRTPQTETFLWDGLALIQRGDEQFINEPHVGGGNPVASSKGTSYFNDALGTTVGAKKDGKYSAAALTAFGENLSVDSPTPTQNSNFFTGKPYVEGLGHAFWMRNYRAGLAKWQTADPMGYPDGWNQLAYCGNNAQCIDIYGMTQVDYTRKWTNFEFMQYYYDSYANRIYGDIFDTDCMNLTDDIWSVIFFDILPRVEEQIDQKVRGLVRKKSPSFGDDTTKYSTYNSYDFKSACWALGDGTVSTVSRIEYSWWTDEGTGMRYYIWTANVFVNYSDVFKDPLDIRQESPFSNAYSYFHVWDNVPLVGGGVLE